MAIHAQIRRNGERINPDSPTTVLEFLEISSINSQSESSTTPNNTTTTASTSIMSPWNYAPSPVSSWLEQVAPNHERPALDSPVAKKLKRILFEQHANTQCMLYDVSSLVTEAMHTLEASHDTVCAVMGWNSDDEEAVAPYFEEPSVYSSMKWKGTIDDPIDVDAMPSPPPRAPRKARTPKSEVTMKTLNELRSVFPEFGEPCLDGVKKDLENHFKKDEDFPDDEKDKENNEEKEMDV
jgi:hypothetical protein